MKLQLCASLVIMALTSPAIAVIAAQTNYTSTGSSVMNLSIPSLDGTNEFSVSESSFQKSSIETDSVVTSAENALYDPKSVDMTEKRTEELKSPKNTETASERKGWDGSVKGSSKGITESGIKKNEAKHKEGTVVGSGGNGISQAGIKKTEAQRKD